MMAQLVDKDQQLQAERDELEAARETVKKAEESSAKIRAGAEESCNKWEQAYEEAQQRCAYLDPS